jgi:tetratricopeptide (TPR) repeat protein
MASEDTALSTAARRILASGLVLALGACSVPKPYVMPTAPQETAPAVVVKEVVPPPPAPVAQAPEPPKPTVKEAPEPPSREFRLGPATQALVNQAKLQITRGELPGASGTLDRALRIEPQNPLLWIEVARLRLTESDPKQAENCAKKALILGSTDANVRMTAGHLLADALRAQKRDAEAADLEQQPWMN